MASREWYGSNRDEDPRPASAEVLHSFFPEYSTSYEPIWVPTAYGESIEELYTRAAYVIAGIIQSLDADPGSPKSILICTHAATFIALGRVLTGHRPTQPAELDIIPFTACLSKFQRRRSDVITKEFNTEAGKSLPKLQWEEGAGVGGGWDCTINSNCDFLSHGPERGWYVQCKTNAT